MTSAALKNIFIFITASLCLVFFHHYVPLVLEVEEKSEVKLGDLFTPQNPEIFSIGYMHDRAKLLQQKCKSYLSQVNHTSIKSRKTEHVMKYYVRKYSLKSVRYEPRYSSFHCLQHKAGSTHYNRVLSDLKDSFDPLAKTSSKQSYVTKAIPHALEWLKASMREDLLNFAKSYQFKDLKTLSLLSSGFKNLTDSVLLVRHPLSRLYSSWGHFFKKNKLHGNKFKSEIHLMQNRFTDPTDPAIPENYVVTLVSFLRYLIHKKGTGNFHWESIIYTCKPCEYDGYDIIIHTNTAVEDIKNYGKFLGKEDVISIRQQYAHSGSRDADEYVKYQQKYWRENVPKNVTIELYKNAYHWDFELFGFTYDDYVA